MNNKTNLLKTKVENFKRNLTAKEVSEVEFSQFAQSIEQVSKDNDEWILSKNSLTLKKNNWEANLHACKKIQLLNKPKIIILGESVALGYGHYPYISTSQLIQKNNPDYQVIDLTRVSLPMFSILKYERIIEGLEPEYIFIHAGNNFFLNTSNNPSLYKDIETYSEFEDYFLELYDKYVSNKFTHRLKQWKYSSKISYIIPMANTKGIPAINTFAVNDDILKATTESIESNVPEQIQKTLKINPLCPRLNYHYAQILEDKDRKLANIHYDRANFLMIDKTRALPGMNYIMQQSMKKSFSQNGIKYISSKDLFGDHYENYHADYCHLNINGIELISKKMQEQISPKSKLQTIKLSKKQLDDISMLFTFVNLRNESYPMLKDTCIKTNEINILNFFNNQTLFMNKTYQSLMRTKNFIPILSHFDYKMITPYIVPNSNLCEEVLYEIQNNSKIGDTVNLLDPNYAYYKSRRKIIKDYKTDFSRGIYSPMHNLTFPKYKKEAQLNIIIHSSIRVQELQISLNNHIFKVPFKNEYAHFSQKVSLDNLNNLVLRLSNFNYDISTEEIFYSLYRNPMKYQARYFQIVKAEITDAEN